MSVIPAKCSQPGNTMRGSMANLALYTGAENVVSLYASLLHLTIIQPMTTGRLGHLTITQAMTSGRSGNAQFVAANYTVQAQDYCGTSDERSC